MAVVKNLMVRAGADFSAITKQASKAKSSMSGMQTSVTRSCSRMSSAVSGMSKVFRTLGVTLSAVALVSFGKRAKEAYDTQAEAETKLAQVMRNTIGASNDEIKSIKDLIAAQQKLGVIGDEIQLAGAQELATYVTMTSTLKKLIPVMNDMVVQQYGLNASQENAANIATMLGKVMSGQTSGLSRYGYYFTEAQEQILKYGTEAQRAATLAEVVEQSVGGMNAALAATPSGRLKQVSNTLGDIKEKFGQAVTNALTVFLPALNTVCSVLANMATLANKVAQAIANVFGGGASSASTMVSYTGAASGAMDDLTDATEAAGKAAEKLNTFGFDQITKLSDTSSGSASAADAGGSLGSGTISETTTDADKAGETVGWLEKALNRLKQTASSLNFEPLSKALERLRTAAEPLKQNLFDGLEWAYTKIFEPMAHWTVESAIPDFLDMLSKSAEACSPALERLGKAVAPLVADAFNGLKWAYDKIFIPLGTWVGTEFLPEFLGVLADAADVLSQVLDDLKPLGTWLWEEFLQPLAKWAGDRIIKDLHELSDTLSGISEWLREHKSEIDSVVSYATDKLANMKDTANLVSGTIEGLTTGNWEKAKEAFANIDERAEKSKEWFSQHVTEPIKNYWNDAMSKLKEWGSNAWTNIKSNWSPIGSWFSSNVAAPVKNWWNNAMSSLKERGSDAWANIKNVWGNAKTWFSTNVTTPISNGFKTCINGIISFFEGMANSAIRGVNSVIGALNKISFSVPSWVPVIGGKSFGFSLRTVSEVKLPRLATGGVVDRPTPALIGEAGPEAVVPLSENAAWLDALASRIAALTRSGNGMKLTIPVYAGGRKLTQVVIDDINEIINTTGECPIHI